MIIKTSRFGTIKVEEKALLNFRDGMIGFPRLKKFVLLESPSVPLVLWLQSVEDSTIAFPLIEPWFFRKDYKPTLNPSDQHCLDIKDNERVRFFNVLTIPEDVTHMTVNLRAPVAVNIDKKIAAQIILQDKGFEVKTPAYPAFSKAMTQFPIRQSADNVVEATEEVWTPLSVEETVGPQ